MSISLLGQASGGFTQSNSALRILHVGVRNTVGQLTADSFTQTNPPVITTNTKKTTASGFTAGVLGVLSGSIAFTRNDEGEFYHGGPTAGNANGGADNAKEKPIGIFINTAVGLAFTNQPGVASNRGPYVSAQGTYGNTLYETQSQDDSSDLTYTIGDELFASVNGYLTNATANADLHDVDHGSGPTAGGSWTIGILTVAGDTSSDELVYDQRI